ncbi:UNVERIFIED_CONTAM: hypothetical protein FKN15_067321 [Acipenser sinensis]
MQQRISMISASPVWVRHRFKSPMVLDQVLSQMNKLCMVMSHQQTLLSGTLWGPTAAPASPMVQVAAHGFELAHEDTLSLTASGDFEAQCLAPPSEDTESDAMSLVMAPFMSEVLNILIKRQLQLCTCPGHRKWNPDDDSFDKVMTATRQLSLPPGTGRPFAGGAVLLGHLETA